MAKKRSEVPWLHYPRTNKVFVINSHNFGSGGGAFSPAVNGKMPVAAWIPTRTQTAEDLIGSNDGTLTNGASIVSNTNAGGTYAFSFDGVNDFVNAGIGADLDPGGTNVLSVSAWIKRATSTSQVVVICRRSGGGYVLTVNTNHTIKMSKYGIVDVIIGSFPADTNWHHIVGVWSASGVSVYVDGVLNATSGNTSSFGSSVSGSTTIGGTTTGDGYATGLIDDVRVWRLAIDATDIADLYASGNGRGVDAS
jgi:hypothetical protein